MSVGSNPAGDGNSIFFAFYAIPGLRAIFSTYPLFGFSFFKYERPTQDSGLLDGLIHVLESSVPLLT